MQNTKADLIVVNLDPQYPQASIDAMTFQLRDTRVISAVEEMKPIDLVLHKRNNAREVSTHDVRRALVDMRSLMDRVFTEAKEQPTKKLVILVPRYVHRNNLATLLKLCAKADEVVCTGSD